MTSDKRKATISDVAHLAEVSVATVSRVMNRSCFVNSDTMQRVYSAVETLSYEPNISARNLRKNESGAILIMAPNLTNPYYAQIQGGIVETARQHGCSAFICSTMGKKELQREVMQMLPTGKVDGAVVLAMDSHDTWIQSYADSFPVVLCSEYNPELNIGRVSIDNYAAGYDAAEYLISLGHRDISLMSSTNDYISTQLRLQGFRDALLGHNIPFRDEYIVFASADYSFTSSETLVKKLLLQKHRPTAIFCISDVLAMGAICGAQELGISVPKDLTVIGIDDLEYATMLRPQLTTIAQPCHEIGVQSAEMLFKLIVGKPLTPEERIVTMPHKLIIRDSSAMLG